VTIAFGDLQGCHRPLRKLLAQISPAPTEPIWFCGDLVNRGPDSLRALRTVFDLGERAVTVLGNHDLHLLAAVAGTRKLHRGDTLQPILDAPDRDLLVRWLRTRPLAHLQGDYLLVHAGVVPQWDAWRTRELAREVEAVLRGPDWGDFMSTMYGNQPDHWDDSLRGDDRLRAIVNILTRVRYLDKDGRLDLASTEPPARAPAGYRPWFDVASRGAAGKTVVFGHWSTLGLVDRPDLVGLDTGCVWGGCLSAMRLETRQLYQVKCPASATPGGQRG
jgi:bis(5'-nucleosyl)-tetraphosphatase (symmetrical)